MKRTARDALLMVGFAVLVWWLVFKQISLDEVRVALQGAKPQWIAAALGAMVVYFLCEASNTMCGLRAFGYRTSLPRALHYSTTGFFFSAITPSSSGGQPMQIVQMRKHGIEAAHSTLVLLIELACWQLVAAAFGAAGLYLGRHQFAQLGGGVRLLAAIGIGLNLFALVLVLCAICFPDWANRLAARGARRFTDRARTNRIWQVVGNQLIHFATAAPLVRRSPRLLLRMLLMTMVQLAALYSVPFWIYTALGLSGPGIVFVAAMQAVVSLSVSSMPLPGAMGVGEGGFLAVFAMLFPAPLLGSAMLLSRGISFYLMVLICGVAFAVSMLRRTKPAPIT